MMQMGTSDCSVKYKSQCNENIIIFLFTIKICTVIRERRAKCILGRIAG